MKIIHSIGLNVDEAIKKELADLNFNAELGIQVFEIDDNDPVLADFLLKIKPFNPVHTIETKFTKSELKKSEYLKLNSTWHFDYPQPEEDFGYLKESFNLDYYCNECGAGAIQKKSILIKNEPKWGKRGITQLHWIYDSFFVKKDIFESIFKKYGVDFWKVVHYKKKDTFETFVQLKVDKVVSLNLDGYEFSECNSCRRKKYLPIVRGAIPAPPKKIDDVHIFRSQEDFGSGASSFNYIFISNEIYTELAKYNIKGISLCPMI